MLRIAEIRRHVDGATANLLDEARESVLCALISQPTNPREMAGSCAGPTFAAEDDPMDYAGEAMRQVHALQHGLHREESHRRRRLQQQQNPLVGRRLVLDGDAEPDVQQRLLDLEA
jgi:hypothetical protein